ATRNFEDDSLCDDVEDEEHDERGSTPRTIDEFFCSMSPENRKVGATSDATSELLPQQRLIMQQAQQKQVAGLSTGGPMGGLSMFGPGMGGRASLSQDWIQQDIAIKMNQMNPDDQMNLNAAAAPGSGSASGVGATGLQQHQTHQSLLQQYQSCQSFATLSSEQNLYASTTSIPQLLASASRHTAHSSGSMMSTTSIINSSNNMLQLANLGGPGLTFNSCGSSQAQQVQHIMTEQTNNRTVSSGAFNSSCQNQNILPVSASLEDQRTSMLLNSNASTCSSSSNINLLAIQQMLHQQDQNASLVLQGSGGQFTQNVADESNSRHPTQQH
ncbi:unnamed protein product, partial [Amoebophrya sp. A25]